MSSVSASVVFFCAINREFLLICYNKHINNYYSKLVCQYLKGSSTSGWSSSGIWLGQPRRKIITMSSPPLCVRHLTGGDPLDAQEPLGSERSMRTSSPRTLGSTRHGGKLWTGRSGIKSSVYGNALLGVRHQEEEKLVIYSYFSINHLLARHFCVCSSFYHHSSFVSFMLSSYSCCSSQALSLVVTTASARWNMHWRAHLLTYLNRPLYARAWNAVETVNRKNSDRP